MSYKKVGMIRSGLTVGGYSVAKYKNAQTGGVQLRLMRNGRAVARESFATGGDFVGWYSRHDTPGIDNHDFMLAIIKSIKDKPAVFRGVSW